MKRRLLVLVPLVLTLMAIPTAAHAHAVVASSQPEAGQRLGTAPGVVVLEFTEPLNAKLSRATVTDPTGRRFTGGVTRGAEIRVPLSTNAPGVYTVQWVSVSTLDGHAVRGSFQFGVGVSPTGGSVETAQTSPGGGDIGLAALRWVEYLALLVAVGTLLLRRLARGRTELAWVRSGLVIPLAVALASGLAVVAWEAFSAAGTASVGALWSYLTTGLPGVARLSRLGLETLALLAAVAQAPALWLWLSAAIAALAASGHGAAIHPAWWGITVDGVHLLAAGVWVGGILALATQQPPGGWRSPAGRELLVRFSPAALTAFTVTVGFGVIQAIQELGTANNLVGSSYGQVLLVKIGLVALMVPASVVAWRVRRPSLRYEGLLAVFVVAAAAVLAAFPIPPSRLIEEEAEHRATPSASARPRSGDLTMGSHAGQILVGLTIRPGRPGANQLVVYLLPLEGEEAAAGLKAQLIVGTTPLPLAECGSTCRRTTATLTGEEAVQVRVEGSKGGMASFRLPELPAPDGSALLDRAQERIHRLTTYRLYETLSSGLGTTIPARYEYQGPNRLRSVVSGRSESIWIGTDRYTREQPGGAWRLEQGGPPIPVPSFIWDYFKPFVDPRIIGTAMVDGIPTTIVSFTDGQKGTPIWFRLWIDPQGLVRRAEMRAPGHFMNDRYYDFDAPFTISRRRVDWCGIHAWPGLRAETRSMIPHAHR